MVKQANRIYQEAYLIHALQKLHFLTRIDHKEVDQDLHFSNNRVRVALKEQLDT